MGVPTVASLVAGLGEHLRPVAGVVPPDEPLSAVHISELLDPTAYLSGGELLLTTGLSLPAGPGVVSYVERLVRVGVAALGFGSGPVHPAPPAGLVDACRERGLPLLVVPEPTPFITISRTYWTEVARSGTVELTDQLAAQRALVDAATSADPIRAVVRTLARWLIGWAAVVGDDGEVAHASPAAAAADASALEPDLRRMEARGGPTALSVVSAAGHVLAFPLGRGRYLAVGSPRRIDPVVRRTVVAAADLLGLVASREQVSEVADEAASAAVATLLAAGEVHAARLLAAGSGIPPVGETVRLLAVRSARPDAVLRAVLRAERPLARRRVDDTTTWFALSGRPAAELAAALRAIDPDVAGRLSPAVPADRAGAEALVQLGALAAGGLELDEAAPTGTAALLARLDQPALRQALEAYLRHRGQWEAAARAVGWHRNTLRYRIARVRERLGVDLDDPDVAARLWLTLRFGDPAP